MTHDVFFSAELVEKNKGKTFGFGGSGNGVKGDF